MTAPEAIEAARERAALLGGDASWFVDERWDDAHEEAKRLDDAASSPGSLRGLPLAVKANVAVKGLPLTAASAVFGGQAKVTQDVPRRTMSGVQ